MPKRSMTTVAVPTVDRPRRPGRVHVLIVLHADGFVECFGPDCVSIVIRNLLDSPVDATLLEHYLELSLPRSHRELYLPIHRRAIGLVEKRSAEVELQRLLDLETLRVLRDLGQQIRGQPK